MRRPKQPRRVAGREPVPAPREHPAAEKQIKKSEPVERSQPVKDEKHRPATPGTPVRTKPGRLRRERVKKSVPKIPVPTNRKRSSEPYPLSDRIVAKQKARRKRFALRLGILLATIALLGGAIWLLFYSAVFAVEAEQIDITVDDPAGVVDANQVRTIVEESVGTPVLRLPAADIENRLRDNPAVHDVQVSSSFPHGVTVTVIAEEPVACVGAPDSCIGISADAVQLEVSQEIRDTLPKISLDLSSDRAAEQLDGLLDAVAALPGEVRARVQSGTVSDSGLIEFTLDSGTIKWGTSDENDKKARIIAVLINEPAGTYDVTVPDAPVTY